MSTAQKPGDPKLGAELRAVRQEAGLSQEALGQRLGVTHGAISRIETGTRSTSIEMVHAWYRECGYELEAVQVGTPEQATSLALAVADLPKTDIDTVIIVVRAWPRLSERQRGRIIGIIESHDS